jgi:hypothetical protein
MVLVDENAFGLLVLLYDLSDLEYGSEPAEFVRLFSRFRELVLEQAAERPLGAGAIALALGHAVYFEVADGEQSSDPVAWLKGLCTPLVHEEFALSAILTHGGRWTDAETPARPEVIVAPGGYRLLSGLHPSEPLQRALAASAYCHSSEGDDAWGPGLYVDTEAVEALGKVLKNAPTPLEAAGATFYRLSLPSAG